MEPKSITLSFGQQNNIPHQRKGRGEDGNANLVSEGEMIAERMEIPKLKEPGNAWGKKQFSMSLTKVVLVSAISVASNHSSLN